jgi:hypothetical protein
MSASPEQLTEMDMRIRLSKAAGDALARRAAEKGQDVAVVASDLIEQAVTGSPSNGKGPSHAQRLAAWDAWVLEMRDWSSHNLPPDHHVDDSRESIYEGRGT